MQALILVLVIGAMAHDRPELSLAAPASWSVVVFVGLAPKLLLAAGYWLLARVVLRRLSTPRGADWLHRLDVATVLLRPLAAGLYLVDLGLGALLLVRRGIGDLILVDELLVMAPTLLLAGWLWWAYYPVDRRLREAALIRRLDHNLPLHPLWTRGQFLLAHLRLHLAQMMAPLLILLAWGEIVRSAPVLARVGDDAAAALMLAGVAAVVLLAPLLIRRLADAIPLPEGDMRRALLDLCRRHRVGLRELLLWRTHGTMVNGGVMGLLPPIRYIMLTDALLETLPQPQVEAVMAHELAHVRRRHIPWLMAAAIGPLVLLLTGLTLAVHHLAWAAEAAGWLDLLPPALSARVDGRALDLAALALAVPAWAVVFLWVSRRFERQADTFAVQHLARQRVELARADAVGAAVAPAAAAAGSATVDLASAHTMCAALQAVADHAVVATPLETRRRRAAEAAAPLGRRLWRRLDPRIWRHGSIAARQTYLDSLIGQPMDDLAIDRQVRWIKAALAAACLAAAALMLWH